MSATALWYLGRSSGIVSFALLTVVLVLGIVTRAGRPLPGLPRFAVTAVHRSSSLLALTFLGVHIVSLTLDPQSQLRWIDAVIPFGSHYRPLWVGLGALSLDLMAALVVTSLLRRHIGRGAWRFVHWTAYALWPFALLHTIGSGTDIHQPWMVWFLLACSLGALLASGWRTSQNFLDDSGRADNTRLPSGRTLASTRGSR